MFKMNWMTHLLRLYVWMGWNCNGMTPEKASSSVHPFYSCVSRKYNMHSLTMSQLLTTVWNSCCDCLQEQFWVTYENPSHCCIIRGFQPKIVLPSLSAHFNHQTWPPVTFRCFQWLHLVSEGWKSVTKGEKNCIQINNVKDAQPSSQKVHVWKFILRT